MKIAYVIGNKMPTRSAWAVNIINMCSAFAENGHDVCLYCFLDTGTTVESICRQYDVRANFKIIPLPSSFLKKNRLLTWTLKFILAFIYRHKFESYDIVYTRIAQLMLFTRAKVLYEMHTICNGVNMHIEQRLFKRKNLLGIICITSSLREDVLKQSPYLQPSKVIVAQDGARVASVNPCMKVDKPLRFDSRPIVGYFGSLAHGKCMEVVGELAKKRKDIVFHIVGGKDEAVKQWRNSLSDVNNIIFYGYVENRYSSYYYSEIDIFLLPIQRVMLNYYNSSVNDIGRYTSPLKLFEAMSYGKAIIASSTDVIKEVLTDGVNALLADPEDIGQWSRCIDKLLSDELLRKKLGDAARRELENKYTWKKRARFIINYFMK